MWLEKLNAMKKATNTRTKTLAERMHMSERTVSRMLSGETGIDIDKAMEMVSIMGGDLAELFDGSDFKIPTSETIELRKEIDALKEEIEVLKLAEAGARAEAAAFKEKAASLDVENDRLRIELAHKEEIITIHTFYMKHLKEN